MHEGRNQKNVNGDFGNKFGNEDTSRVRDGCGWRLTKEQMDGGLGSDLESREVKAGKEAKGREGGGVMGHLGNCDEMERKIEGERSV